MMTTMKKTMSELVIVRRQIKTCHTIEDVNKDIKKQLN